MSVNNINVKYNKYNDSNYSTNFTTNCRQNKKSTSPKRSLWRLKHCAAQKRFASKRNAQLNAAVCMHLYHECTRTLVLLPVRFEIVVMLCKAYASAFR